ncbi:LLM class flavin-dependent oxidoreductase [Amycolatopsis sp. NPDC049252]|uniref:LLM class flavin-dependent oxidoreductase n=1 Tax=Amycolatopsis sp. NPDC049252 TaxID=3363933 RepID=UPI00371C4D13
MSCGLDAGWVADHLAVWTSRVGLGTIVSAVMFRSPALLIKAVSTLDVASGGRARFGIGARHHDGEAQALGPPFLPVGARFERMAETVRVEWPIGNARPARRRPGAEDAPAGRVVSRRVRRLRLPGRRTPGRAAGLLD